MIQSTPALLKRVDPSAAATLPPVPEAETDLRDLLLIVKRQWKVIALSALLATAGACLHTITSGKKYSATATIEIHGQTRPMLGLDDVGGGQGSFATQELMTTDLLTQQAQLTSASTALAVIERLRLDSEPEFAIPASVNSSDPLYAERGLPLAQASHQRDRILKIFAAHLQVAIVKGTRLIEITYTDASPAQAASTANAIVSAYTASISQGRSQNFSRVSTGLADQLSALKMKVVESQKEVEEYQKETGLAGVSMLPGAQGKDGATQGSPSETIPVSRLQTFNQDLTNAEVARLGKAAIYKMTQSEDPDAVLGIPSSPTYQTLAAEGGAAPNGMGLNLLQGLREQLTQIDIEMATAAARYGQKSEHMLALRDRDTATRKQISAEMESVRARAKKDLELATLAESGLHRRVAEQEQLVTDWSGKVDHLLLLEGEASSSRELYQDLYTKLQEADLASGINSTEISVLDPARQPSVPSSPKRARDTLIGLGVGTILGIMLAFVLDYFDESVHSAQEIIRLIQPPPIAAVTLFPRDGGHFHGTRLLKSKRLRLEGFSIVPQPAQSCLVKEPRSEFSEAYRTARTALLKTRSSGSFRSLVVASGLPGEGRAAACFNLAVAFALLGDRVLLLDADMHGSPLSFGDEPGLSDCLMRDLPLDEAIQKSSEAESLFFLPAGVVPLNPAELSSSKRFADLLNTVRSRFDYVFINSPSVLLFSEASILSSLADGYMLVLRAGKTRRQDVLRTLELLRSPHSSLMGVFVNDAVAHSPVYSQGEQFMGTRQRA